MDATQAPTVKSERLAGGRLARLVLDSGRGNVIGSREIAGLREAATHLAREPRLCGVLLDHAGPHFSFGASVPEHLPGRAEQMVPALHALARELLALDLPLLCAVRGTCLGGGLELALLADRLVVAPDVRLGQPEIKLGLFAPLASALLPRRAGASAAADLLLTGRTLDAAEALALGIAREVAEDPGAAARAFAEEHLAPRSAAALRLATRAARRAWKDGFLEDLEALERMYLGPLMDTEDAREGLAAFLAKRAPRWEDR